MNNAGHRKFYNRVVGSALIENICSISQPPVIDSFFASPFTILAGQSANLAWSVRGNPAPDISIDNGVGAVAGNAVSISPSNSGIYTLTASNSAGTATQQAALIVITPLPVISSFSASPSVVSRGETVNLSWSVSGSTSLSINNGVGSVSGNSISISPEASGIYTLTATNSAGSVTSQTAVIVK